MLDNSMISQLCQGWKDDNYINWQNVTKDQLNSWCIRIENAINRTINEVLEINSYKCKVDHNKIVLMDGETFGKFAVILWDAPNDLALTDIVKSNFDASKINIYYEGIDKPADTQDYDKEGCRKDYSSIQGLSYKEYQIINKMSADGRLGLHLLCHEIFHTLASPCYVEELRTKNSMGDEATNEFIARLVSKENNLGCTTTDEMSEIPDTQAQHNKYGCYGKALHEEKFCSKEPDDIKKIIKNYLSIK